MGLSLDGKYLGTCWTHRLCPMFGEYLATCGPCLPTIFFLRQKTSRRALVLVGQMEVGID